MFHFKDDEHIRIVNSEGADVIIKWQNKMEVISYTKTKYGNETIKAWEGGKSHPLIDQNPTNSSWYVLPRLRRRCH